MNLSKEIEIEVVELMIKKYCHKKHKAKKGELCEDCDELLNYVKFRRSLCPWKKNKPFCSNCKIHCYEPKMREKIRDVMKFSGPRMIFDHPIIAFRHVYETNKEKRRLAKIEKNKEAKGNDR